MERPGRAALVGALVFAAVLLSARPGHAAEQTTAAAVLAGFDAARPGYGVDYYWAAPIDHEMAYAVYTSAVAKRGDIDRTKVGADFLVAHAHDNPKGVGWGLGFPWRACLWQTTTTNRANTIYMVYTAEAADALLDAFALTGDTRYKDTAAAALNDQLKYFHATTTGRYRTGWFPYSTSAANRRCEVYNVLGMQLGVYARASVIFADSRYADVASRLHNELWLARQESATSIWWQYGRDRAGPQDAIHEAFIAHGFAQFTDSLGPRHDETKLVAYLASFVPSRMNLWGLGELMAALCERGRVAEASALRDLIPSYEFTPGQYLMTPDGPGPGPEFVRHRAYLLRGLAELEAATAN